MKDSHNMTGKSIQFNNNHKEISMPTEKKEPRIGFWDVLLTIIFFALFFGCIYLYFENKTQKVEVEQKHGLIMDLAKLLERKK